MQPVPFRALRQARSGDFLRQLIEATLLSTQSTSPILKASDLSRKRDRSSIEKIFIKVAAKSELAKGLRLLLEEDVLSEAEEGETDGLLKWAAGVAVDTLKTTSTLSASLADIL